MTTEARRVPFFRKLAFGVGQSSEGLHQAGINAFLILYYQQVLGLPASLAGAALLVAMIFDAVSDPAVGVWSDHVRSRWGRRHPFMLFSAVPLALCWFALFCPPDGLSTTQLFAWLIGFAVLMRVSITFFSVPHSALGAEMAPHYDDRSMIFAISTFCAFMAGVVGLFSAYTFFFPEMPQYTPGTLNPAGYPKLALVFGGVMMLAVLLCSWGTRKEIPNLHVASPTRAPLDPGAVLRDVRVIFRNRSFLALFGGAVFGALTLNIDEILTPFVGLHFWELPTDKIRWLVLAIIPGFPIALLLVRWLPSLMDKRNTAVTCFVAIGFLGNIPVVLRLLEVSWFPQNGTGALLSVLLARGVLVGALAPAGFIMLSSMMADVCDEIELESGRRIEGLVFSTRSFALKVTSGLGNLIGGIILDLIAFPTNATVGTVAPEILFKLGLVVGPLGAGVSLIGMFFYMRYKLDRSRHAEIVEQLHSRRGRAVMRHDDSLDQPSVAARESQSAASA